MQECDNTFKFQSILQICAGKDFHSLLSTFIHYYPVLLTSRFLTLSNIRKLHICSTSPQGDDVYDPDRDFVPLFDFSAPLTGFGDDFDDEGGEKHT